MKKPEILSDEMIDRLCRIETRVAPDVVVETFIPNPLGRDIAQAQLDADVAYYEPLIQQAKQKMAKKIMELAKHEFEYFEGSDTESFIYSNILEES